MKMHLGFARNPATAAFWSARILVPTVFVAAILTAGAWVKG